MARLRLRVSDKANERLDSDAEVLHFPVGGVFGAPTPAPAARREPRQQLRIVREVEDAFEDLERRLEDLRRQIDHELAAGDDADGPWRPPAA